MDDLKNAIETLCNAFKEFANAIVDIWQGIVDAIHCDYLKILCLPNSRVKRLALYHKKARVRKKNLNRLLKELKSNVHDN